MKLITRKKVEYRLDKKTKTAIVRDYKGKPVDVIIPKYVRYRFRKYKVVEIGDGAFWGCNSLTKVIISDGVTKIGEGAFENCTKLIEVNIPDSVTEIEDYAFNFCKNLHSIDIPDSVIKIDSHTFDSCYNLTSVTIPNSVTEIEDYAFSCCKKLQFITIPNSVISIGNYAFYDCSSLISINISNNLTKIGEGAFYSIGLTLLKKHTEDGRLIAYKAFNADMTCRNFQYEEGKTYEVKGEIKCCYWGIHACTNILDIFNYYRGKIGENIFIHEVYLSGDIDDDNNYDSKVCASKIEIGPRLSIKDINDVINS